jgi:hypothetical protein
MESEGCLQLAIASLNRESVSQGHEAVMERSCEVLMDVEDFVEL